MLKLRSKAGESCLGGDLSTMVLLGDEADVEAGKGGCGSTCPGAPIPKKETEPLGCLAGGGFAILGTLADGGLATAQEYQRT